ncbi:fimbrial protein [Stenotrophomonas geniculata]|jgi:type 1 fimbria pilin|nr:fimbrial protein [Stenotrophomonas geniculata]MCR1804220.1 fimbrial protein [Stenotrophomonas geniculata]
MDVQAKRAGLRIALGVLCSLGFCATAVACTSSGAFPMSFYKTYDASPPYDRQFMDYGVGIASYSGCSAPSRDMMLMLDMPGLRPAGTVTYDGMTLPVYDIADDSPLIGFAFMQVIGWPAQPLTLGASVPYVMDASGPGDKTFNLRAYAFSRKNPMRTYEMSGSVQVETPDFPALGLTIPLRIQLTFPHATCPLLDTAENLRDVDFAELSAPSSTAGEKVVAMRMDCGTNVPRARISLYDAADAGNTGSQLTPIAGSDAGGVRIQILRAGSEVRFGQQWDFDPGVGGMHNHEFTARYVRTADALTPGIIKGEAVLNVDYW